MFLVNKIAKKNRWDILNSSGQSLCSEIAWLMGAGLSHEKLNAIQTDVMRFCPPVKTSRGKSAY